jgi:hypothetical protein
MLSGNCPLAEIFGQKKTSTRNDQICRATALLEIEHEKFPAEEPSICAQKRTLK